MVESAPLPPASQRPARGSTPVACAIRSAGDVGVGLGVGDGLAARPAALLVRTTRRSSRPVRGSSDATWTHLPLGLPWQACPPASRGSRRIGRSLLGARAMSPAALRVGRGTLLMTRRRGVPAGRTRIPGEATAPPSPAARGGWPEAGDRALRPRGPTYGRTASRRGQSVVEDMKRGKPLLADRRGSLNRLTVAREAATVRHWMTGGGVREGRHAKRAARPLGDGPVVTYRSRGAKWTLTEPACEREGRALESGVAMIVDCHQHFWDLEKVEYPWLVPAYGPIYRTLRTPSSSPSSRQPAWTGPCSSSRRTPSPTPTRCSRRPPGTSGSAPWSVGCPWRTRAQRRQRSTIATSRTRRSRASATSTTKRRIPRLAGAARGHRGPARAPGPEPRVRGRVGLPAAPGPRAGPREGAAGPGHRRRPPREAAHRVGRPGRVEGGPAGRRGHPNVWPRSPA